MAISKHCRFSSTQITRELEKRVGLGGERAKYRHTSPIPSRAIAALSARPRHR